MNHAALKIYVAGSSREREDRAVPIIKELRKLGLSITHDWTVDMQEFSSAQSSDSEVPDRIRRRCSTLDFNGVRQADFVLLLAPHERGSSGAWVEFGFAIGQGVPVVVAGPKGRRTIFTSYAERLFTSDGEAVTYLAQLNETRG